jgi:3-hydroxyisobutyrate dehydrogenase
MTSGETVAVLGAGGTMGFPMASNMARAGLAVRAWNRSRDKAEPLADDGVEVCDTPGEAADGTGVVVTMLADTDAVIDSVQDALRSIGRETIWLQMSTVGEAGTERCAALAEEHGVTFIDAPVLGTKQPAEQAKLVILASGPEGARDRLQPIFDAVGQKTMWVGDAGAGTRLKIVTNSWVLTVVEGGAETIALAQGLDLDPNLLFDALDGGALDLPYLRMKGKAILEHNFEPLFRLSLAAKDAALVEESARRHHVDVPLFSLIKERMAMGAKEHGDEDMCATYFTSAPDGKRA